MPGNPHSARSQGALTGAPGCTPIVCDMSSQNVPKFVAAGAVAAFLALGAYTLGHAGSSDATTTAAAQGPPGMTAGATAPQGSAPQSGTTQRNGTTQSDGTTPQDGTTPRDGTMPQGGPPGFGTDVTGATATKVAKAATARYSGQVERVMQLPDGSYVAHVITSNGEVHVHVSPAFKVLGVEQGGPPQTAPSTSSDSKS